MFERFTDPARRAVVLAQEEARLLSHNYIGTEHVLLGLLHEGEGLAALTLRSLGVDLDAARARVEELIGEGSASPSGHMPFTPRAKKALELSLREALGLGHNYIGTEHLLLGLVREGKGVAAQVLVEMGVDLARVRQRVVEIVGTGTPEETASEAGPAPFSPVVLRGLDDPRGPGQETAASPGGEPPPDAGTHRSGLSCSFCAQPQERVAKLVAGPGVYICDRCIALCQEILDEELGPPETAPETGSETDDPRDDP